MTGVASPRSAVHQNVPVKRRPAVLATWALQVVVAGMFLFSGVTLFFTSGGTFAEIGAGDWLRYLTGALEVLGAVGILVPRVVGPAAIGLVGVMAGAVFVEIFVLAAGSPIAALLMLVLSALVAWLRRDTLVALWRTA